MTEGYKITYVDGTLTVTDGTNPDEKDVPEAGCDEDGGSDNTYKMGDTVEWTITVTNIYDETKTLTVTEAEGMEIVGNVPATLSPDRRSDQGTACGNGCGRGGGERQEHSHREARRPGEDG